MALKKAIVQEDGVTTNYHRILFVQNTPNSHVSIGVVSLISDEAREAQQNGTLANPYQKSTTYETESRDAMTIAQAYEWLKNNIQDFADAEDVFEEGQTDEVTGDELVDMLEEVL